ncbi:MAG: hypothetical protein EYC70_05580 [Planctomycetota bacterium]|nr:MAG: hypothetical protein EYC70_05580 [Planctomycetota bacterium]
MLQTMLHLFLCLPGLTLAAAQGPDVTLTAFPKDLQLYPRDAAGHGTAQVAGSVDTPGYSSVELRVYREGVRWDLQSQPLSYAGGSAPFAFSVPVPAELAEYDFELHAVAATASALLAAAQDVVAGDVFLIQGQSNAVAGDGYGENLANAAQRPWIRSYGTASIWDFKVVNDDAWGRADGEDGNVHCTIGQWGLRMAQLLVDQTQVPVCVLNGAVGATPIKYHLRNDADPMNPASNYGRLLFRATRCGVAAAVKAIFWYQGESNGDDYLPYAANFAELYADWLSDYPAAEKIYVFQVHNGCGAPNQRLRELQRRFEDLYPLVDVLSTTAAPDHDGCHYRYSGYRELGNRAARLVARDFYASPLTQDIDAPDLERAYYSNTQRDEITLVFRDPDDTLRFEAGAQARFTVEPAGDVRSGTVTGPNTIRLRLDGPATATSISYDYPAGSAAGIVNARGVGALTFFRARIQ